MDIKYFKEDIVKEKNLSENGMKELRDDKEDLVRAYVELLGREGAIKTDLIFCRYDNRFFIESSEIYLNSLAYVFESFEELTESEYNYRLNKEKEEDCN
jgi:hypothetical protein